MFSRNRINFGKLPKEHFFLSQSMNFLPHISRSSSSLAQPYFLTLRVVVALRLTQIIQYCPIRPGEPNQPCEESYGGLFYVFFELNNQQVIQQLKV